MLEGYLEYDTPATQAYLNEERAPRLSREQERNFTSCFQQSLPAHEQIIELIKSKQPIDPELYALVEQGRQAMEIITRANRGLVIDIAKKHLGQGVPFLDLVQEGNIGLMDAAAAFEPEKDNLFGSYATWKVRARIGRAVDEQGRVITLSVDFCTKLRKAKPVEDALIQELGRIPYDEELLEHLPQNWQDETYRLFFQYRNRERSIHEKVGENRDSELQDFIAAENNDFQEIDQDDTSDFFDQFTPDDLSRVMLAVQSLPEEQAEILLWQFGFKDGESHKDKELALLLNISKKAIQARRFRAMRHLREVLIPDSPE